MAYEIATAYVSLVPSMKGAQGQIASQLVPDAAKAGESAGSQSGGLFNSSFVKFAAVGAIVAGVGAAFKGLYEVGSVFDDVADTIRVGTGASGEALEGLTAVAQHVGQSIPADFSAVGSTVADLNTRLGLTGGTLDTVAQQYLEAGRILGTDVDINATSAAFSAFQIEGEGVVGAMDSLFQVSQATGVGMNELAGSVQSAAPALQTLGFSFKDSAALAGSLDKAGLNTGQVMNGLGKALVTLAKDGEEPQAAFQRTTQELQGFIDAGDKGAALDLASQLFGTKGANQFVAAMESGTLSMTDLFEATGASSDTIIGLGKETMDAAESWQILKNNGLAALEPLGSAVFGAVGSALGVLAGHAEGAAAAFQTIQDKVGTAFETISYGFTMPPDLAAGLGEKINPLLEVGVKLRELFNAVGDALAPIGAALGSAFSSLGPQLGSVLPMLSPFGLIFNALLPVLPQVGALIGDLVAQLGPLLGGVLEMVIPLIGMLVETLSGVFVAIMPTIVQLVAALSGAMTTLVPVIMGVLAAVMPLVMSLVSSLAPILIQLVQSVMPPIITIFTALVTAIAPLITIIAGLLIPIIQALLPVVVTVFGVIASVITAAMQIVQGIIQVVTGIISGNWSQVWDGIKNILSGVWNAITSVVSGAMQIIGSVIGAYLNVVASLWSSVWNGILGFLSGIWGGITGAISGGIGNVVNLVSSIKDKVLGAVSGAGQWLWDAGKNVVQGLMDGIKSLAGSIGSFFLDLLPGWIVGPFKTALGIHSPSRVFREFGGNIGEGLMLGIGDTESAIDKQMASLVTVPAAPRFEVGTDISGGSAMGNKPQQVFNVHEAANPYSTAVHIARLQGAAV
ncbi:phage tail tape measure protein [Arthrobacter sp. zg-Y20]|uniref:phage tail tape measure protein n=1 Tax=unclassified Arthrobacter TaxID=235627 RepID=UPI001D148E82|nr:MULTISPECIES: phage tail tape measure protein [unclassified Arthrobacter]MCC3277535.1 phage tail tape measure protein [Arthrobacter sp. zg-Y20]MDK1317693.1 phage tail tape measure protein [Arthrobacter sp. zg.Y20]WIB07048.1 phage tail tape measure protein [Arthrobacter sp. zg-Y20]